MMNVRSACTAGLLSLFLLSCGPTETDIRNIVSDVLAERAGIRHVTKGETIGPYSPAVEVGRFVFLSGQIGMDPATRSMAGDDIASQTRQALKNIGQLLADVGLDSSAVIQCTVYLTDIRNFQQMNVLYGGYFSEGKYPARTTVEVSALPAGALIEIAAIAYKEQS